MDVLWTPARLPKYCSMHQRNAYCGHQLMDSLLQPSASGLCCSYPCYCSVEGRYRTPGPSRVPGWHGEPVSWEQPSVHDLVDKDASPDLQLGWHGSPHHLPGPHSVWTHLILVPYPVCQWLLAHSLHSHPILSASACSPSLGQQLPTG